MELHKSKVVSLKSHPSLTEKWLQDEIIKDPTILGLGDVIVRSQERTQPKGGRLDLLLEDPESGVRYEVELQLGVVDESHIIRTIEYWDLERKRYPQYDHVAVIVAEEITSRFFNVIGLFNGFIPLIAIQLNALEVNGYLTLNSTRVLDVQTLGTEEDDSPALATDRPYWDAKSSKQMLSLVDNLIEQARVIDPRLTPRYNKFYVGLGADGMANNFIIFKPRKKNVCLHIHLPKSKEIDELLEGTDMQLLDYEKRWGNYRVQLTQPDLDKNREVLMDLMRQAYKLRNG
jgi:hypothetical protein